MADLLSRKEIVEYLRKENYDDEIIGIIDNFPFAQKPEESLEFIAWKVEQVDDVEIRRLLEAKDVAAGRHRLKSILLQMFGKQI